MKGCLVICNKNAAILKDVFPLIKSRVLSIGYTIPKDYIQPEDDEYKSLQGLTRWITTLNVDDKPKLILKTAYSPNIYKTFDNYRAINVDNVKDIPIDYNGYMGVPIGVLEANLSEYDIVGRGGDIKWATTECEFYTPPTKETADTYKHNDNTWRIQNPYILIDNKPITPYTRIFIKKHIA